MIFPIPAILQPGSGNGAYFGSEAPSDHIFFPICSNGSTAAFVALLTFFAAMNATHMNTRAIISIIIVPKIPHAEERTPFELLILATESLILVTFHLNAQVIHPITISFTLTRSLSGHVTFRTILFSGFHIIPTSSHQTHRMRASSQGFGAVRVPLPPMFDD